MTVKEKNDPQKGEFIDLEKTEFKKKSNFFMFFLKSLFFALIFFGLGMFVNQVIEPNLFKLNLNVQTEKSKDKPQNKLSDKQQKILKSAWVSAWDIIKANSGGHKCITNISGLMYLPKDLKKEMIVGLQKDIVLVLKDRIKSEK